MNKPLTIYCVWSTEPYSFSQQQRYELLKALQGIQTKLVSSSEEQTQYAALEANLQSLPALNVQQPSSSLKPETSSEPFLETTYSLDLTKIILDYAQEDKKRKQHFLWIFQSCWYKTHHYRENQVALLQAFVDKNYNVKIGLLHLIAEDIINKETNGTKSRLRSVIINVLRTLGEEKKPNAYKENVKQSAYQTLIEKFSTNAWVQSLKITESTSSCHY